MDEKALDSSLYTPGRLGENAQLPDTQIHELFSRRLPLYMPEAVDIRKVFPIKEK